MFKVFLARKAEKSLDEISEPWQGRIVIVLRRLTVNPHLGKKLEGKYKNYYSIRVWPYRIIYTIKNKELIVQVIEIEHRGGAYRK